MRTRSVILTDESKLDVLRVAACLGVSMLERGEFKEFRDAEDLKAYLYALSEKVISSSE